MARSNVVLDPDSLWYSFRPERVLVGENSVFEFVGMVSPVHYFPKLYEVLTLPLAAAQETTLMQAPGIVFGALLARLVCTWLRELGHDRATALAGAALAWSIPAFSNITLGAKPDTFAALMVVAMAWFCWRFQSSRDARPIPWLLAVRGARGRCETRGDPVRRRDRNAFPRAARAAPSRAHPLRGLDGLWPMAGAAAVLVLVGARTVMLAGMPTVGPEQLVTLWNAMGMTLKFPVGTLDWTARCRGGHSPHRGWAGRWIRRASRTCRFPGPATCGGCCRWRPFSRRARCPDAPRWLLWLLPARRC